MKNEDKKTSKEPKKATKVEKNPIKESFYTAIYRRITVKTIDGETIVGKINLSSKQRVSDIFTRGENPFIILVDAVAKDVVGKTLFINKKHIIWAEPDDDFTLG